MPATTSTPVEALQQSILESVRTFTKGASQSDDITLLVVRYRRPPEPQSRNFLMDERGNPLKSRRSLIGTIHTMADPKMIGRYEIVAELGRGAMGSVFKATDPAVGRTVAIKTIHSAALQGAQSAEYRARFQREARASGVLAHPGIVPVFDVGEHEGAPFLVMEFVEGRTLADAMKKGERFTLDRVCEIGQQLAEALGYAHRQGVIHRDIKPANILLTSREVYGAERPRIMDFGIAKLVASEITTTGQMLGTPSFMPPEQFTGAPIDGRADLFSLGVILYALATGEQPFPGETMTAVSYKVVYTEPIPPAKLNPAVPARLEAVILKCLAKSPADRYQTGEELAQDLAAMRTNAGASTLRTAVPAAAGGTDDTLAATPSAISHPPAQALGSGSAKACPRAGQKTGRQAPKTGGKAGRSCRSVRRRGSGRGSSGRLVLPPPSQPARAARATGGNSSCSAAGAESGSRPPLPRPRLRLLPCQLPQLTWARFRQRRRRPRQSLLLKNPAQRNHPPENQQRPQPSPPRRLRPQRPNRPLRPHHLNHLR